MTRRFSSWIYGFYRSHDAVRGLLPSKLNTSQCLWLNPAAGVTSISQNWNNRLTIIAFHQEEAVVVRFPPPHWQSNLEHCPPPRHSLHSQSTHNHGLLDVAVQLGWQEESWHHIPKSTAADNRWMIFPHVFCNTNSIDIQPLVHTTLFHEHCEVFHIMI